jgi:hypothetical protein
VNPFFNYHKFLSLSVAPKVCTDLQKKKSKRDNDMKIKTFMTFARQAIGKKSSGAADVANSMPAPNSSNRSAENRSCQKLKFKQSIICC